MGGIQIKKDIVYYYGNMAGYIAFEKGEDNGVATLDNMFRSDELGQFLQSKNIQADWADGVFDRLTASGRPDPETGQRQRLKDCRIWQLKPEADLLIRFIGYDELKKSGGEPDPANYKVVFDGQIETNNLEEIYTKFNINHPQGFEGHSLSISDVVELYDNGGSEFHYVDRFGFKEIRFEAQQEQQESQQMNQSMTL